MKRIYVPKKKNSKREKIEQDALAQLRRVRAQMKQDHPDLLDDIQKCYQAAQKTQAQKMEVEDKKQETHVPIDRAKNLETVARFLQITNSEMIKKALLKNGPL